MWFAGWQAAVKECACAGARVDMLVRRRTCLRRVAVSRLSSAGWRYCLLKRCFTTQGRPQNVVAHTRYKGARACSVRTWAGADAAARLRAAHWTEAAGAAAATFNACADTGGHAAEMPHASWPDLRLIYPTHCLCALADERAVLQADDGLHLRPPAARAGLTRRWICLHNAQSLFQGGVSARSAACLQMCSEKAGSRPTWSGIISPNVLQHLYFGLRWTRGPLVCVVRLGRRLA